MTSGVALGAILAWLLAVAVSDWRSLRIPNSLIVAALTALIFLLITGRHPTGLSPSELFIGFALVLVIGAPGYFMGWYGAGDLKLMAVIGAILGPGMELLQVWAGAALLAAVHILVWRGLLFYRPALPLASGSARASTRRCLPHGVHIAAATAAVLCSLP